MPREVSQQLGAQQRYKAGFSAYRSRLHAVPAPADDTNQSEKPPKGKKHAAIERHIMVGLLLYGRLNNSLHSEG